MTGTAVTTNPLLIMVINMTIVFAVLFFLGWIIKLIHLIDPTRKKQQETSDDAQAVASDNSAAESAAAEEIPLAEKELAAVILTAIMACGYQNVKIKSIKKV